MATTPTRFVNHLAFGTLLLLGSETISKSPPISFPIAHNKSWACPDLLVFNCKIFIVYIVGFHTYGFPHHTFCRLQKCPSFPQLKQHLVLSGPWHLEALRPRSQQQKHLSSSLSSATLHITIQLTGAPPSPPPSC